MKPIPILTLILFGLIVWPLTTKAGQNTAVLLTPTQPCSTLTPTATGTPTNTPTIIIGSLVAETPLAPLTTPLSPQEGMVLTTTTPTPTLLPCIPLPPCPNIPTVSPLTPTYTPTATSSPCATHTPTPSTPTASPTTCFNTPTPYPPTPSATVTPVTPVGPTATADPCQNPTLTPIATTTTPSPTPCFNTPTVMPPTPTPWGTPTIAPISPTPTAVPCLNTVTPWVTPTDTPTAEATPSGTPTLIPTTAPVFTATVGVFPHTPLLEVGDLLTVTVTLDVSQGCQFPILELTLSQDNSGDPPFAPSDPIMLGPGVPLPTTITLTAVTSNTTTFTANLFGERNCGNGWHWQYASGQSTLVTVASSPPATPTPRQLYLPLIKRD